MKNNCCIFERLFKIQKNGIFLFRISLSILEILMFLYFANKECKSDDVVRFATTSKMVKYWIKNFSGNIEALFFKLGTRNVHHRKRPNHGHIAVAVETLLDLVSFCRKPNSLIFNPLSRGSCLEQTWLPYCLNSHH